MTTGKEMHLNSLANEASPYLLQHAHNPVDWKPWGDTAFQQAKKENKLVLISIGYSACHWCHVMENESFSDEGIAAIMNEHYICIKVDREERPDVDNIYMKAVQLMTGHGGWPLNCFAMSDGSPVYGGTYFPPERWKTLLVNLARTYREERINLLEFSMDIRKGLLNENPQADLADEAFSPVLADLKDIYKPLSRRLDLENGGFDRAPKFPMPSTLRFQLRFHELTGNQASLDHVLLTLTKMTMGGIFDQLGGGFARYATDKEWRVPHFEKMLYDNAQILSLLAEAFRLTGKPFLKDAIYSVTAFLEEAIKLPSGAYASAIDADSDGEEGRYYTWEWEELRAVLEDDLQLAARIFSLSPQGNWENGLNILYWSEDIAAIAEDLQVDELELREKLTEIREALKEARSKRVAPARDDKAITSWNAMVLSGLVHAGLAVNQQEFISHAKRIAEWLLKERISAEGEIMRITDPRRDTAGFLDDYAFTVQAFTDLYSATFEQKWLDTAVLIAGRALELFRSEDQVTCYYTPLTQSDLFARPMEKEDNVIPSACSVMAVSLFRLGSLCGKEEWKEDARRSLYSIMPELKRNLGYYSNWGILLTWIIREPWEVIIMGEDALEKRIEMEIGSPLDTIFSGSTDSELLPAHKGRLTKGQTMIYPCRDKTCQMPVECPGDALVLINP